MYCVIWISVWQVECLTPMAGSVHLISLAILFILFLSIISCQRVNLFNLCEIFVTQGAAEFLGRTRVRPLVILDPSAPKQPMLQWYEVKKGKQSGGELLMAFELFLVCMIS